jgi:aldose 1-epimerase
MVGSDIKYFTLTNSSGASVTLSNMGAGIISVIVPDKDGNMADVALGYAKPEDYFCDGPCMGKVPGRYANRIAFGKFSLAGKEYSLSINNGPNHLHGGPGEECWANRIWFGVQNGNEVSFALESPDGDAGYPGNVMAEVIYRWNEECRLTITFRARSDADTVINLTNHAYFNLKGEGRGDIKDHTLQLGASNYLPTDETLVPTGLLAPVEGTPMDFRTPVRIGEHLFDDFPALRYGKGYDNCWAVDGWEEGVVRKVAELTDPTGGRRLIVRTDAPGIQIYTGNWLKGSPVSKSGTEYDDYYGVALECQSFPDSPNQFDFPSALLAVGDTWQRVIEFHFTK